MPKRNRRITVHQLWEVMTAEEQDAMIISRQLSMHFISRYWCRMSSRQQGLCIRHRNLSWEVLSDKWSTMEGGHQKTVVHLYNVTSGFVSQHLEETHDFALMDIIRTISLELSVIEKCWERTDTHSVFHSLIIEHQQLPISFIEDRWGELGGEHRMNCYLHQYLPPEFAMAHWLELSSSSRMKCMELCIKRTPQRDLPMYLTHPEEELRHIAIDRMRELFSQFDGRKKIEVPSMYE